MDQIVTSLQNLLHTAFTTIADTIHSIWPEATMQSAIAWSLGIGVTIVVFLINQKLNIVVIQPKCRFRIRIDDKSKSLIYRIPKKLSTSTEIDNEITNELSALKNQYNPIDINFNNFLELQVYGQYNPTTRYNELVDIYIKEEKDYITAKKRAESMEEYLKPIPIVLRNVGTKAAGKTTVSLTVETTGHLYDEKCTSIDKYSISEAPDRKAEHLAYEYWDVTMIDDTVFKVKEYNLDVPFASSSYQFTLPEVLQSRQDKHILTTFYIDTRTSSKTTITWAVIEGSMRKEAEGKLTIKVKK